MIYTNVHPSMYPIFVGIHKFMLNGEVIEYSVYLHLHQIVEKRNGRFWKITEQHRANFTVENYHRLSKITQELHHDDILLYGKSLCDYISTLADRYEDKENMDNLLYHLAGSL